MAKQPDWTKEEDEQLRSLVTHVTNREIAEQMGRSYHAIITRNIKLGLKAFRRRAILWTPADLLTFQTLRAQGVSCAEVAKRMGRSLKSIYSRISSSDHIGVRRTHWTENDLCFFRENASSMTAREFAEHFGRSRKGIRARALEIGVRMKGDPKQFPRWSEADIEVLRVEAGTGKGVWAIARLLSKSASGVYKKAREIGVEIISEHFWTPEQIARLRECAEMMTATQAAAEVDRTVDMVRWKASRIGVRFLGADRGGRAQMTIRRKMISERFWTVEEVEMLRTLTPNHTLAELASITGRSLRGVERKRRTLGLTGKRKNAAVPGSRTHRRREAKRSPQKKECKLQPEKKRFVSERQEIARVAYCGVCSAPVANTPHGWAGHNERVGCNRKAKRA